MTGKTTNIQKGKRKKTTKQLVYFVTNMLCTV